MSGGEAPESSEDEWFGDHEEEGDDEEVPEWVQNVDPTIDQTSSVPHGHSVHWIAQDNLRVLIAEGVRRFCGDEDHPLRHLLEKGMIERLDHEKAVAQEHPEYVDAREEVEEVAEEYRQEVFDPELPSYREVYPDATIRETDL